MGRNITYKILDNLPIKVVVGAYDTSATICWKYSATICEDGCNSSTTISTACENKPIEPNISCESTVIRNGTITWNDKAIAYTIEQLPRDCEKCGEIAIRYELTDYWLVPSVIYCDSDPNSKGKLYFEYYEIQEDDCQIKSKEKKLGETAFTYDVCGKIDEPIHKEKNANIHIPNDDESIIYTVVCEYDCAACTECTPNSSSIIIGTITYDKSYVLCSGGDVNYTINYKIISYDKNCNKSTLNKIKTGKFTVPQCDGNCCKDHYAITSTTITETVGEQTLTETVSLSILMKKDYNNSCDEDCGQSTDTETKYCVGNNSTVYYPTIYNGDEVWVTERSGSFWFLNDNNEWVKVEGDGVGCVPKEGGKIKVEFQYTAYTHVGETVSTDEGCYRLDDTRIYSTKTTALEAAQAKYPKYCYRGEEQVNCEECTEGDPCVEETDEHYEERMMNSEHPHVIKVPCTATKTLTAPMIQTTCQQSPIKVENKSFTYETANSQTSGKDCNIVKYEYWQCCSQGSGGGAEPVGPPEFHYGDENGKVHIGCKARNGVIVPYVATTTYSDGTTRTTQGSSSYTISIECKDREEEISIPVMEDETLLFTIVQEGKCICSQCEESDFISYVPGSIKIKYGDETIDVREGTEYTITCEDQDNILNSGHHNVTITINYQICHRRVDCEEPCGEEQTKTIANFTIVNKNSGEDYTLFDDEDVLIIMGGGCELDLTLHIEANKLSVNNVASDEFIITYWGEDINGNIVTDGVNLENVTNTEVEEGKRLECTLVSEGTTQDEKKFAKYSTNGNDENKFKYAKFKAKYGVQKPIETEILTIEQAARDVIILPDFDYLTFTFTWSGDDGDDLDTATFVEVDSITIESTCSEKRDLKLSECPVGYSCDGNYSCYIDSAKNYIEYGGDNRESGNECAVINWKKIIDRLNPIPPGIEELYCNLYGNWYERKANGLCTMTMKTYKGGDGLDVDTVNHRFTPKPGTDLVETREVNGYVYALGSKNINNKRENYSHIAEFIYLIEEKKCIVNPKMKGVGEKNGREIRGYMIIDGVQAETQGNGSIRVDKVVPKTGFTTTIRIDEAYYSVDSSFPPTYTQFKQININESFVSATFENNVLTINVANNGTSLPRNARVEVVFGDATSIERDLEYDYYISQLG